MNRRKSIVVIGGGINGRMIQHIIPSAHILDWNPEPTSDTPRFYGANYLWASIPGILCREVSVVTTIDGEPAVPEAVIRYKTRIGKAHETDTPAKLVDVQRTQFMYHSRGWLIERYPPCTIEYNAHVSGINLEAQKVYMKNGEAIAYDFLLSTIPLPSLLTLAGVMGTGGTFRSHAVKVRVVPHVMNLEWSGIHVDYITNPSVQQYRSTYRDGARHDETLDRKFEDTHGTFHTLVPGKIWDTPESELFRNMLAGFNVYTFGRYGSWQSDELVHQTVKHVVAWANTHGLEVSQHARHVSA